MALTSSRSKYYFYNSMVCLVKALEGKRITVEMRNDIVIEGILDFAEATMNLNMSYVTLRDVKGRSSSFCRFYVKGRQIRYVLIPDEIDIKKAMEWQLTKSSFYREKESRFRAKSFQRIRKGKEKAAERYNRQEQS